MKKVGYVLLLILVALGSQVVAYSNEAVSFEQCIPIAMTGAEAFDTYCTKCHVAPDIINTEPPAEMYNYAKAFGATAADIENIKEYILAVQGAYDEG